jgi:hypothetical protein
MPRYIARLAAAAVVFALAACAATTTVTPKFRDPNVGVLSFNKIAAVAISTNGPQRRLAEAEMAREIGPKAFPVSQALPSELSEDPKVLREALASAGFDGAVTMRLLDFKTELAMQRDPVPTQYMQLWDYYAFTWAAVTEPSYLAADTFVEVEVNIYDVKSARLLWSGVTRSERPQLVETLIKDVAPKVRSTLQREGLLPRK